MTNEKPTTEKQRRVILYVEDDENDVIFMERAYKEAGLPYPIMIVKNGEEALEYLAGRGSFAEGAENQLPCLILLDLKLPLKTGFEVLRWIREQFKNLPVVIYTSSAQARDRELAASLGATDYVVKPSAMREIPELLKQISDRWIN